MKIGIFFVSSFPHFVVVSRNDFILLSMLWFYDCLIWMTMTSGQTRDTRLNTEQQQATAWNSTPNKCYFYWHCWLFDIRNSKLPSLAAGKKSFGKLFVDKNHFKLRTFEINFNSLNIEFYQFHNKDDEKCLQSEQIQYPILNQQVEEANFMLWEEMSFSLSMMMNDIEL